MARTTSLAEIEHDSTKSLARSLQSGNLNFLMGAGASVPAIPAAGNIEQEIVSLLEAGDEQAARSRTFEFLSSVQEPTNRLIADEVDDDLARSIEQYQRFLNHLELLLFERRTTLLPRQASVFTTNYDMLLEKASEAHRSLRLNDGFTRVSSLDPKMEFSSQNFFSTFYATGNLYDYKVELPSINLIKLHGSLSWENNEAGLVLGPSARQLPAIDRPEQVESFIEGCSIVLPGAGKYRTTLMEQTYYELLRIFANELDRENSLLLSLGFSFRDDHIRHIVRRSLKNPTLRIMSFAHQQSDVAYLAEEFKGYDNFIIVAPEEDSSINFGHFNGLLGDVLSKRERPE